MKLRRVRPDNGGSGGDHSEALAFKAWLALSRDALGLRQEDVAEIMGVTVKTVQNMESPKAGLPRALSLMRYLRALGVVSDAPISAPGLSRLESIEMMVSALVAEMTAGLSRIEDSLESLAAELSALADRLPPEDRAGEGQAQ